MSKTTDPAEPVHYVRYRLYHIDGNGNLVIPRRWGERAYPDTETAEELHAKVGTNTDYTIIPIYTKRPW